ncbi:hypothetical protein COMA2_40023 [Candidatus Nitrospira nitrificans]|uniref:Uncharacterized protein n=1 Tax=Candidatus Nitrospira nitrificans TaxID=1742973 RepID=A0A0S4LJK5_9BACT|nr:hypothetical protein COMA2_40023 [Candidatus Nitrospira nitrificans]
MLCKSTMRERSCICLAQSAPPVRFLQGRQKRSLLINPSVYSRVYCHVLVIGQPSYT